MDWKRANVTPIFKKGAKSDPGNYRPVSLTSVSCKILESIIKDKLMAHFEKNMVIFPSQHGFMPKKSCATNLLEFFETVTKLVDEGQCFEVVFLDFSKAFDKVPLVPLLAKLEALGVTGQLLNWVKNWLQRRVQRVVINGESSDWEPVESGVPQGSILGPVLFDVHINDIDLVTFLIDIIRKFADDTKLGNKADTQEQRDQLQATLNALVEWAKKWGMSFNVAKCKVMHFGLGNVQQSYYMNGVELGKTNEERDIGVTISNDLKPSAQCKKAAMTASKVSGQLSRHFHYRDRHVFTKLYCTYVRPHLEFATTAWTPWTAADIREGAEESS